MGMCNIEQCVLLTQMRIDLEHKLSSALISARTALNGCVRGYVQRIEQCSVWCCQ